MIAEDLALIGANAIMFLMIVIIGIIGCRRRYARLHPPVPPAEIELQLERELEAVNKQIETLQEPEG